VGCFAKYAICYNLSMSEIKCPKCGTTFKVDDSSYADILSQVRGAEFENELHKRLEQEKKQAKSESALESAKLTAEIEKLKTKLGNAETEKQLAITEVKASLEKQFETLSSELKEKAIKDLNEEKSKNAVEIEKLKNQIKNVETEKQLAVANAIAPLEKERDKLAGDLKLREEKAKLDTVSIEDRYKGALKLKDEEIERLKDMKAKLSTKMVGETLEQHCQTEFNRIRMTAFPKAYFEKDNDARTGSKGDFIFRECDEAGNEIISIMFEMKNENETTATKHKNEDFFKELDKDRKEKKCEYAVLVSMLEADDEYYNTGIVDVSYRFEKMYVIRPQFFIPIITLLRNAALNSLKYKAELAVVRDQNIDITNFENDMNEWKAGWLNTMKNAGKKHLEAIEQINKAIKDLEKTRDALMLSDKHLASAEGKLDDLTIKKLTRGNPTMKAKFDELDKA